MKNRIFMYLFIFTLLLSLFLYMNSRRIIMNNVDVITEQKTQIRGLKASDSILKDKVFELQQFNIERNDMALDYFEKKGYDISQLIPVIKDALYSQNEVAGEHPLVPYGSSEGNRMQISGVRIINHKWILAEFTDGQFNGELFLTYSLNEKQELNFKLVEHLLYPL